VVNAVGIWKCKIFNDRIKTLLKVCT